MNNSEIYCSMNTGEYQTRKQIVEEYIDYKVVAKESQMNGLQVRKSKDKLNMLIGQELGAFYFYHMQNEMIDPSLVFRFLYLTTYMNYDGVLMYGGVKNGKHHDYMQEKDLREVMGLSINKVTEFKKALYSNGLVSRNDDGKLIVNADYCDRGKQKQKKLLNSTRMFDEGIQELYKNSAVTSHKKIGLLAALLPCVNKYHNVLCSNPSEQDAGKIVPLSIQDICRKVGTDVSKARRLEKELISITVKGEYSLMASTNGKGTFYSVNPRVYYAGNDIKALEHLINMFRIG